MMLAIISEKIPGQRVAFGAGGLTRRGWGMGDAKEGNTTAANRQASVWPTELFSDLWVCLRRDHRFSVHRVKNGRSWPPLRRHAHVFVTVLIIAVGSSANREDFIDSATVSN